MFTYTIVGNGQRDFSVVSSDGTVLSEVRFEGWMGHRATGRIGEHTVTFTPPRLFRHEPYMVEVDGFNVANVLFGWFGRCRIVLEIDGRPWPLRLERVGFFDWRHRLSTEQGVPLVDLTIKRKWFAAPDYAVSFPGGSALSPNAIPLVLTVTGYAAALIRRRQAAAAAAT